MRYIYTNALCKSFKENQKNPQIIPVKASMYLVEEACSDKRWDSFLVREWFYFQVEFLTDTALLSPDVKKPIFVMVAPAKEADFKQHMAHHGIRHEVTVADLAM